MERSAFIDGLETSVLIAILLFACACIVYFLVLAMKKTPYAYPEHNGYMQAPVPAPVEADPFGRFDELVDGQVRRANLSLYFSLIVSILGLLMIVFCIIGVARYSWEENILRLLGSLLVEVVAAVFFLTSLRAQREMTEAIKTERDTRMTSDIIGLVAKISDPNRRDQMISQLIMKRSGLTGQRLA
ncbi:TRADD-N-associated membrane domain-containing protein [Pseudorhizobium sp. NPDC055634]